MSSTSLYISLCWDGICSVHLLKGKILDQRRFVASNRHSVMPCCWDSLCICSQVDDFDSHSLEAISSVETPHRISGPSKSKDVTRPKIELPTLLEEPDAVVSNDSTSHTQQDHQCSIINDNPIVTTGTSCSNSINQQGIQIAISNESTQLQVEAFIEQTGEMQPSESGKEWNPKQNN